MQSFPDEFDGLVTPHYSSLRYDALHNISQVIGSPAAWHSHLRMWAGYLNSLVEPNTSDRYISEELWKNVVHKKVLNQCDEIDGVGRPRPFPSVRSSHGDL